MKIRDISPFGLRIRPDLKEWFLDYSKKDKRSMTYSINEAMEFFKQHKEEKIKNANI
ncbi:hypothetical protein J3U21_06095 [Gilliamella sp. B2776]|uniref:hypothetical protein n=1 Tax=unclassified Gilliamella TaxID=2685620 RepID=UPI00226A69C8|nr:MULTISPECIES: hypothetical protein [unclassified Gilliamella]MCX8649946.1 hypothetical protein [Gilliamella sp. B2779]MCX8653804.1 hypothetical protein [Gilliamella sp. B2737]MCX8691719.1 hypothetical protein [Gilliamella sp. B2776]MCX8701682.1 hypothetical protein [Gilliamella sp. B2840]MCX8703040.1 hypothetical protein [Gilliamella sp. B2781]